MPMMRSLLPSFLLLASLPAQLVTATVPVAPVTNVDRPFPGGLGRYQQWFSAASLQSFITQPMRFQLVEFLAGTTNTSQAAQIDCELLIGHGKFSGVIGTFASNWDSPPIIAAPRAWVQLAAGPSGAPVISMPFASMFTWDRVRPVLIEIRIYGNSLNNQPFTYNFRGTTSSIGQTSRVYFGGQPGAPTGTVLQGVGMTARFTARPGMVLQQGNGCPGEGAFVPVAAVQQVPSPGILWTHQLTNAASQRPVLWAIGGPPVVPPFDLTILFGLPPSNCFVHVGDPLLGTALFTTVGGGAGGGAVTFPLQLPAIGSLAGLSLFTQWIVFDPLAPSGIFATSPGLWSIVAPVGG